MVACKAGRRARDPGADVPRFAVARLSGMAWAACPTMPSDSIADRMDCARRMAAAPVPTAEDTATDRTRALTDLAWSASAPGALERATARLRTLHESAPADAAVLNELAVALLVTADRTQALLPALQGLDAAERARRLAPDDPAIAWNVALLQEFLHLPAAALVSWREAERIETDATWREELRVRRARIERMLDAARDVATTDSLISVTGAADSAQLAKRALGMPQWSRDQAWLLLSRWGECELRGDAACASAQRRVLQVLVAAERQRGGDSTVTWAVHDIDALDRATPDARRRRARAHVVLGTALGEYRRASFDRAAPLLQQAIDLLGDGATAAGTWAGYYAGGSDANRGRYPAAQQRFRMLLAGTAASLPVLQGKVLLSLGVIDGRRGDTEQAVRWFRAGATQLERSRDPESLGFATFLLAETLAAQGRRLDSYAAALQSVRMNAASRTSGTLHSQVAQLATLARNEGLPFAALSIGQESVAIARGIGRPVELALAFRDRARDSRTVGDVAQASRDLDSASVWAQRIAQGRGGDRVRAYVLLGRGDAQRERAPQASLDVLLSAVSVLREFRDDIFLPVALHAASRSSVQLGDTVMTQALLTEAIGVLESQYASFQSSVLRASFAETAEEVFDAQIALHLAQGAHAAAFEVLERSKRAAYRPPGVADTSGAPVLADLRRSLPADALVLEYAVLPDRIAIWRVTRDTVSSVVVPVARERVAALTRRAQPGALRGDSVQAHDAQRTLYDLLLRPALQAADSGRTLIIVPDRELFQLSFALLRRPDTQAYAIESYELGYAPSASFARNALARRVRAPGGDRLLAMGNDAARGTTDDSLPALTAAEREAAQVATLYPRHLLLTGAAVSRAAVQRSATTVELLHFAGHAVFDEARPERSYLLLAGAGDAARFRAEEIAALRSSRLRLVILSACRTLNARASRVGPASGLAYSFLQAGAAGTITSLWDVDDGDAAAFMTAMHRHLAAGRAPAAALRLTQLEFLQSADPRVRSPRRWAGFTLTGR